MAGQCFGLKHGRRGMADDKRDPDPAQDLAAAAKRRRPAPTIDLKATEVASEAVTPAQATDSHQETPVSAESAPAGTPAAGGSAETEAAAPADPAPNASQEAPRWGRPAWRLSAADAPAAEKKPSLHARL